MKADTLREAEAGLERDTRQRMSARIAKLEKENHELWVRLERGNHELRVRLERLESAAFAMKNISDE